MVTSTKIVETTTTVIFNDSLVQRQSIANQRRSIVEDSPRLIDIHQYNAQKPLIATTKPVFPATNTPPPPPSLLRSLQEQAGSFISTVCSCVQESQTCITTTTKKSTTLTEHVTTISITVDHATTQSMIVTEFLTTVVTTTSTIELTTTVVVADPTRAPTTILSRTATSTKHCPASCTKGSHITVCAPHQDNPLKSCTAFNIECGVALVEATRIVPARAIRVDSHGECMRECDFLDGCNVFHYQQNDGVCRLYIDHRIRETTASTWGSIGWRPFQEECKKRVIIAPGTNTDNQPKPTR